MTAGLAIRPGVLGIDAVADTSGRTRTSSLRQRYPQRVTMPMYCDPDHPGAATLCVQSPSGGAFSDDDLYTTVRCHSGAHLHLTTQAATQVFAGDGTGARHHLSFTVHDGAVLQYYPGTVIPHTDSTFTQQIDVYVDPGGIYLGWEAVAAGRIAHGERHRYAGYDSALVATVDGRTIARDRQLLRPQSHSSALDLMDADYLATFLVVTPGRDTRVLLDQIRSVLGVDGGASSLPHDAGVFVRLTAQSAPDLHRIRQALFATARKELLQKAQVR
ncbi:urease accessory protein UreD [Mycobacterium sp. 236(2023)]|uniref:urease accessory protein UreD n=1 Tax=Mycobacterium sp. 236(2023) TaxID=3038163 RepID=UPI0024154949|nr:urease accessory protein UreD [Mycobacterium sp. 236(2023)]MDG4665620.1 urease accessory protein UreD [Mycobacterium sp. 236(2023)]